MSLINQSARDGNWQEVRIPPHLDGDSSGNWTEIPRVTGHSERSDAG
jgi:hypothetical protein